MHFVKNIITSKLPNCCVLVSREKSENKSIHTHHPIPSHPIPSHSIPFHFLALTEALIFSVPHPNPALQSSTAPHPSDALKRKCPAAFAPERPGNGSCRQMRGFSSWRRLRHLGDVWRLAGRWWLGWKNIPKGFPGSRWLSTPYYRGFIYPFNEDSRHERWKECYPPIFLRSLEPGLRSSTNFRVEDGLAIEICGCDFRLEPCFLVIS